MNGTCQGQGGRGRSAKGGLAGGPGAQKPLWILFCLCFPMGSRTKRQYPIETLIFGVDASIIMFLCCVAICSSRHVNLCNPSIELIKHQINKIARERARERASVRASERACMLACERACGRWAQRPIGSYVKYQINKT